MAGQWTTTIKHYHATYHIWVGYKSTPFIHSFAKWTAYINATV